MSNYSNILYKDYEALQRKYDKLKKEAKFQKIRADIAEDEQHRLEKIQEKQNAEIKEKDNKINALSQKIIDLTKKLNLTELERNKYLAKLNIDGTNAGIPTSQTPINKKKIIPNTREKSDKSIGGQVGHQKHSLEKFSDEEINEHEDITLCECPLCHSHNLTELDSEITKDELDYEIKVIKKRKHYKKYICNDCHKEVRKVIPAKSKEKNQYGNNVQATALTLANIGNVPMNKTRKIIYGLTMGEIDLSEGYIAKLQKRAASKLTTFIEDLKFYIIHLSLVYWDDTVVMINTKRGCLRFYGNEDVALYTAHEKKDKLGLDEDNILNLLTSSTIVEHDHNKVNYNEEYSFINAECCQHLERDLKSIEVNIPERTWAKKMLILFKEYIHKRNQLIEQGIDHFTNEEFDTFIIKIDEYLLLGVNEYLANPQADIEEKEKPLLMRLMEYRDNYIYWTLDFNLPFTNNLSERALRGVKSKMKSAGQFQNINNAQYYANIRSYLETCYRNGINGHGALVKLIDDNPFTLEEILKQGKKSVEKSN